MTELYIKNLIVSGHHGANPGEKDVAQRFQIKVTILCDLEKAQRSDNLEDTISWSKLRQTIVDTVQNTSFNLVERLAQEIVDKLWVDRRVESIDLSVDKLDAFKDAVPGIRIKSQRNVG